MNLSKHLEFFDPINNINASIHIIGCGAVGSTVAEMLTRMGVQELNLYDFDTVSPHNIANQMFFSDQINNTKLGGLHDTLYRINPTINLKMYSDGYTNQALAGYVFLCVDNIDLRREICENNKYNPNIKAVFDFRMRLTDAQHYAADWNNPKSKQDLINSMQFSHEDAKAETPTSACGTTLNIIPTVRVIVSYGLSNFINFVKKGKLHKLLLIDAFDFTVDAFLEKQ